MATAAWASPVEGEVCETTVEGEPTNVESVTAQAEEEQPTGEAPPGSGEQHQADGKSKPASEKIWGSFLKNSGLGKVMGGRKKKEQATGAADAGGEGADIEKSPAHSQPNQGEGASPPSSPKEQGTGPSANAGGAGSQEQSIEKEPEGDEASQEQKPSSSSKDAKPKQGEKSSVRDLIRKPVARIFSHRSTEKKDSGTEAPKHGKTRSKSLDRLEDPEVCASTLDQTDDVQAGGEPHKSASHSAKHMRRWHSFKKLMAQKSLKKSTEDPKDLEGAEGPSDTQLEQEALESAGKLDHHGQKRWKLKRSWTFQGLKRDPSVVGIHKPKGSDKDLSDNLKGEETPADVDQGAAASSEEPKPLGEGETQEKSGAEQEEEKGTTTQRTKSVDHHANEIWTSFKKRVIPKSKRSADAAGGGGGGEEEQAGEHEQAEEQTVREHGKSAKTKRTHFNRAVSLKNFIMRKGKSTSVDLGEAPAGQKEEGGESTGDTPADAAGPAADEIKESDSPTDQAGTTAPEAPVVVQNGGDDQTEAAGTNGQPDVSASTGQEPEAAHAEKTQQEPASGALCGETKAHGENGSSNAGCDGKGSGTEGEDKKAEDIMAHDHETVLQEDGPQEKVKQEDSTENACSGGSKDEKSLNQEQCSERKSCAGNPVAQSGECTTENDCYAPLQTGGDIVVVDTSFELEPSVNGPPQNGGARPGSVETETEPNGQEEDQKRMFYEAAASIVQTVVSAAAEQLAKEKDLLDNGFKGSYHNNNDNYPDLDVNYCH